MSVLTATRDPAGKRSMSPRIVASTGSAVRFALRPARLGERREHLVEALLLVVGRILVEWVDEIFPTAGCSDAAHGASRAIEGACSRLAG